MKKEGGGYPPGCGFHTCPRGKFPSPVFQEMFFPGVFHPETECEIFLNHHASRPQVRPVSGGVLPCRPRGCSLYMYPCSGSLCNILSMLYLHLFPESRELYMPGLPPQAGNYAPGGLPDRRPALILLICRFFIIELFPRIFLNFISNTVYLPVSILLTYHKPIENK